MKTATMKRSIRYFVAAAAVFAAPALLMAAAVPTGGPTGNAEVRRQLASYFANITENSPTVLGGLAKSPDVMAAIQKKIAGMSDEELTHYRKLMAVAPDWKLAPEAAAHAFPPDVIKHIRRVGADFVAESPDGKVMRDDVRTLVAVLKFMPDEKLTELGLNREMVASLSATFNEMSPLQAAMLHRQATEGRPWDATSAAAMKTMSPAVRRGVMALADHGPLTDKDISGLGQFRTELKGLFERIEKLPPETRKTLKTESLEKQMEQLGRATPDTLFMIRHSVPDEMVSALGENVEFLERISSLTDGEKKELEQFRSDLAGVFDPLEKNATLPEGSPSVEQLLGQLEPQHLAILKEGMSQFGNWKIGLPAVYQALAAPDLRDRMKALEGPTADVNALASLEAFRQRTLSDISTAASDGVDTLLAQRARKGMEAATPRRLELIRSALSTLPGDSSASDRLTVVTLADPINFNCSIDMPSPVPDINLDFICNPIESALTTIRDGIVNTVNSVVAGVQSALTTLINTARSALDTAIAAVTSVVNDIVNGLTTLVNQIVGFVNDVPGKLWNLIKLALDQLLSIPVGNNLTLKDLVGRGVEHGLRSMNTLLGLAEGWWTAISNFTLPPIPCPPDSFMTPFGQVGSTAASDNYARYRLIVAGLVGLIPDTEISLAVKIPAQVLFMAFDFLGVCLDQASANADDALAASRHNIVMTEFVALRAHVGIQVGNLGNTQGQQVISILNKINNSSNNIRSTVSNESLAIQAVLLTESSTIQSLVNSETTEIKSLIQSESDATQADIKSFQTLAVRLIIERVLRSGDPIAHLQLLEPLGHLRLVSDIVREAITATKASNQTVGNAEKDYAKGAELMNAGKEKEAFKYFSKAYNYVASKSGNDDDDDDDD